MLPAPAVSRLEIDPSTRHPETIQQQLQQELRHVSTSVQHERCADAAALLPVLALLMQEAKTSSRALLQAA